MVTSGRRRGPRGDLTREAVLAAADRVLRRDGLTGLSLRAVAREAGATPNALYTYVATMAELRNALADHLLATLDLTLLDQEDPRTALYSFLGHVVQTLAAAPRHVEIIAAQRIFGDGSLALNEALLTFFQERLDWDLDRAHDSTMFLTEWVHGHLLLAPLSGAAPDPSVMESVDLTGYPRTMRSIDRTDEDPVDLPLRALFGPV